MRFSVRLLLLTASIIAVPALAFAAFTTPSDLLAAVHFSNQPLNVDYNAHLEMDQFAGSAWVKGQVQSDPTLEHAKANLRVTVDFKTQDSVVSRVSAQVRILDGMMYVRVENLTGMMAQPLGNISNNTWYAAPFQKTATEKLSSDGVTEAQAKQFLKTILNALFAMTSEHSGTIVTYSLSPKPTAATELAAALNTLDDKKISSTHITAEDIRSFLQKVNLHIKVVTSAKDEPKMVKFYASFAENTFPVSAVIQGTSTLRKLPLSVSKPPSFVLMDSTSHSDSSSSSSVDNRNAQRRSDVNTILNAVYQYAIDHNGDYPTGITMTPTEICATGATSCAGKVNLDILTGSYVIRLPSDPQVTTGNGTNYFISQNASQHLTVSAKGAEGGLSISVSR